MAKSLEESIDQFYDANIRQNSWFYFGTQTATTTTEKLQLFFEKYKDLQNTEIDKCRAVKMGCDKVNSELRIENEQLRRENEEGLLTEQQEKDLEEFEHLKDKITGLYQKYYKDQGENLNFVNKFFRFFIKKEESSASEKLDELNEAFDKILEYSNEVTNIINSAYAKEENKNFISGIIDAFKQETYPDTELKISEKLKIFYRAYDALSNDKIEICEEIKQQNKEIKEKFENYHLNWIKENAGILNKNVTVIKNLVSYSALSSIKLNIDLKNDSTLNDAIALYEKGVDTEINLNKILVYLENNAKQQNTFLQKSFDNLKNSKATQSLDIFNKQQESTAAIKNANELIDFVDKKIKSYEAFLGIVITQMMTRGDITKPEIDSYLRDNYNNNKSAIKNMLDFLESKILDMCDKLTGAEIKQQNIEEQSKIYISGLSRRYEAEEKYIQEIIANVNDENLKKILEPLIEQNSKALDEITNWQEKEKIIVRNGIILLENLQKEKNSLEAEQAEYIEQADDCDILKQQLIAVQDEIKYQQDIMQTLTQDKRAVMEKYRVVAEKLKSIVTDEESLADITKEIYDATVKIDLSQEETNKTINKLQDEKKICEDKIEAMTAEAAQKTEENEIKFRQIAENSEKEIKQKKEENEKKASAEPNVVEAVQTVFEKYYGKLPNYAEKLNTQIKSRMSSIGQMLSLRAESPKAEVRVPKALKAPIISPEVDVKKQLKQSISNIQQSTALWLSR